MSLPIGQGLPVTWAKLLSNILICLDLGLELLQSFLMCFLPALSNWSNEIWLSPEHFAKDTTIGDRDIESGQKLENEMKAVRICSCLVLSFLLSEEKMKKENRSLNESCQSTTH